MRRSLPAAAIALALLAGCSHARDSAGPAPAPVPSSSGLPPMFVPSAGASPTATGTTTTAGGTTAGGTSTGESTTPATASPKPPSRLGAGIESLRTTWVSATVTRVGPGKCIGLTSTDGTAYAVYLTQSAPLTTGSKLRAKIIPGRTPVDCGAGRPARSDSVLIAR